MALIKAPTPAEKAMMAMPKMTTTRTAAAAPSAKTVKTVVRREAAPIELAGGVKTRQANTVVGKITKTATPMPSDIMYVPATAPPPTRGSMETGAGYVPDRRLDFSAIKRKRDRANDKEARLLQRDARRDYNERMAEHLAELEAIRDTVLQERAMEESKASRPKGAFAGMNGHGKGETTDNGDKPDAMKAAATEKVHVPKPSNVEQPQPGQAPAAPPKGLSNNAKPYKARPNGSQQDVSKISSEKQLVAKGLCGKQLDEEQLGSKPSPDTSFRQPTNDRQQSARAENTEQKQLAAQHTEARGQLIKQHKVGQQAPADRRHDSDPPKPEPRKAELYKPEQPKSVLRKTEQRAIEAQHPQQVEIENHQAHPSGPKQQPDITQRIQNTGRLPTIIITDVDAMAAEERLHGQREPRLSKLRDVEQQSRQIGIGTRQVNKPGPEQPIVMPPTKFTACDQPHNIPAVKVGAANEEGNKRQPKPPVVVEKKPLGGRRHENEWRKPELRVVEETRPQRANIERHQVKVSDPNGPVISEPTNPRHKVSAVGPRGANEANKRQPERRKSQLHKPKPSRDMDKQNQHETSIEKHHVNFPDQEELPVLEPTRYTACGPPRGILAFEVDKRQPKPRDVEEPQAKQADILKRQIDLPGPEPQLVLPMRSTICSPPHKVRDLDVGVASANDKAQPEPQVARETQQPQTERRSHSEPRQSEPRPWETQAVDARPSPPQAANRVGEDDNLQVSEKQPHVLIPPTQFTACCPPHKVPAVDYGATRQPDGAVPNGIGDAASTAQETAVTKGLERGRPLSRGNRLIPNRAESTEADRRRLVDHREVEEKAQQRKGTNDEMVETTSAAATKSQKRKNNDLNETPQRPAEHPAQDEHNVRQPPTQQRQEQQQVTVPQPQQAETKKMSEQRPAALRGSEQKPQVETQSVQQTESGNAMTVDGDEHRSPKTSQQAAQATDREVTMTDDSMPSAAAKPTATDDATSISTTKQAGFQSSAAAAEPGNTVKGMVPSATTNSEAAVRTVQLPDGLPDTTMTSAPQHAPPTVPPVATTKLPPIPFTLAKVASPAVQPGTIMTTASAPAPTMPPAATLPSSTKLPPIPFTFAKVASPAVQPGTTMTTASASTPTMPPAVKLPPIPFTFANVASPAHLPATTTRVPAPAPPSMPPAAAPPSSAKLPPIRFTLANGASPGLLPGTTTSSTVPAPAPTSTAPAATTKLPPIPFTLATVPSAALQPDTATTTTAPALGPPPMPSSAASSSSTKLPPIPFTMAKVASPALLPDTTTTMTATVPAPPSMPPTAAPASSTKLPPIPFTLATVPSPALQPGMATMTTAPAPGPPPVPPAAAPSSSTKLPPIPFTMAKVSSPALLSGTTTTMTAPVSAPPSMPPAAAPSSSTKLPPIPFTMAKVASPAPLPGTTTMTAPAPAPTSMPSAATFPSATKLPPIPFNLAPPPPPPPSEPSKPSSSSQIFQPWQLGGSSQNGSIGSAPAATPTPPIFGQQQFQTPAAPPGVGDIDMSDAFDFTKQAADQAPGMHPNAAVPSFNERVGFHPYVPQQAPVVPGPPVWQSETAEVDMGGMDDDKRATYDHVFNAAEHMQTTVPALPQLPEPSAFPADCAPYYLPPGMLSPSPSLQAQPQPLFQPPGPSPFNPPSMHQQQAMLSDTFFATPPPEQQLPTPSFYKPGMPSVMYAAQTPAAPPPPPAPRPTFFKPGVTDFPQLAPSAPLPPLPGQLPLPAFVKPSALSQYQQLPAPHMATEPPVPHLPSAPAGVRLKNEQHKSAEPQPLERLQHEHFQFLQQLPPPPPPPQEQQQQQMQELEQQQQVPVPLPHPQDVPDGAPQPGEQQTSQHEQYQQHQQQQQQAEPPRVQEQPEAQHSQPQPQQFPEQQQQAEPPRVQELPEAQDAQPPPQQLPQQPQQADIPNEQQPLLEQQPSSTSAGSGERHAERSQRRKRDDIDDDEDEQRSDGDSGQQRDKRVKQDHEDAQHHFLLPDQPLPPLLPSPESQPGPSSPVPAEQGHTGAGGGSALRRKRDEDDDEPQLEEKKVKQEHVAEQHQQFHQLPAEPPPQSQQQLASDSEPSNQQPTPAESQQPTPVESQQPTPAQADSTPVAVTPSEATPAENHSQQQPQQQQQNEAASHDVAAQTQANQATQNNEPDVPSPPASAAAQEVVETPPAHPEPQQQADPATPSGNASAPRPFRNLMASEPPAARLSPEKMAETREWFLARRGPAKPDNATQLQRMLAAAQEMDDDNSQRPPAAPVARAPMPPRPRPRNDNVFMAPRPRPAADPLRASPRPARAPAQQQQQQQQQRGEPSGHARADVDMNDGAN
jgi:hypothetical protein